jgi:hypothetical protein
MVSQISSRRRTEHGQTIVLVAAALIALLSMAALAIDVVTLYIARSETQRAANAAAIAGAKIFSTSGVTSTVAGGAFPGWWGGVCVAPTAQATAVATQNSIAGQPILAAEVNVSCVATPLNPQVTVLVTHSGLPTFFSKIWNHTSNSVSATATAEAYNPSGNTPPIQVSIKPWFIPNCDPGDTVGPASPNCPASSSAPFVNTAVSPNDGSIANNGSFIGETITVNKVTHNTNLALCNGGCAPPCAPGACNTEYYPLDVPLNPPAAVCPSTSAVSCAQVGTSNYHDNIACASQYRVSCGDFIGQGETVTIGNNNHNSLRLPATEGMQCLIHGNNPGAIDGQDALTQPNGSGEPIEITAGTNNPNPIFAAAQTPNISRSDSIVSVPIYDGVVGVANPLSLCQGGACNRSAQVVGFLQLGIIESNPPPAPPQNPGPPPPAPPNGWFQAIILNVAGCKPGAGGNPVSGGGVSPVPVRLIAP